MNLDRITVAVEAMSTERPADDLLAALVKVTTLLVAMSLASSMESSASPRGPGSDHQRLPSGVADALAKRLDVQPETITQIRRRAYQKIRHYVKSAATGRREEAAS